jgi:peptide/nickel transport system substrate-binding protein
MLRLSRPLAGLVAATVVAVLLGAAPAGAAKAPSPTPSPGAITLRIGWTSEPNSLNPFVGYQPACTEIWALTYDQLTTYDATLRPQPQLARSWSHSADGLTWTFKIRAGVKWQDGRPLTAHDVAFTYNYIMRNRFPAFTDSVAGITKVTAPDDLTAVFVTSRPKADMLGMRVPILPEHVWSRVSPAAASSTYANGPPFVGSGPFKVVEWEKGSFIRLTVNHDYWGPRPHVGEILYILYQFTNSMILDLRAGRLDGITGFTAAEYRRLKTSAGVAAAAFSTMGFDALTFNCDTGSGALGAAPLRDPAFRRALDFAIDRQKIVAASYGGVGLPADSLLAPDTYAAALDYHWTPPFGDARAFDLARAGSALTAAGYPLVGGARLDRFGVPITLRLYARAESAESQSAAKLIAGWLGQLGIKIDLQVMSEASLLGDVTNTVGGRVTPDYDMFLWGWEGDVDPDFLLSISTTAQIGGWNQAAWSDPAYDQLYVRQRRELDQQRRRQLVQQMEAILYQQAPFIPLVYTQNVEAWDTTHWQGWRLWPVRDGGAFFTFTRSSYLDVRPRSVAAPPTGDTGTGGGVGQWWPQLIAGAFVVAAAAGLLAARRRTAHERH